jgi:nucleotide-binding universal stress UspA family protein
MVVPLRTRAAPVVAAVEEHTALQTADTAARLARERRTGLAFVSVRPSLPAVPRSARDERRLIRDLFRSRKALDAAIAAASRHGVSSYGEVVEGDPATEIVEFAARRNAPVLVVGRRRHTAGPGVSRDVIARSPLPVVVAP